MQFFVTLENKMCYNLGLHLLKSKTNKGLCVAASSNNVSDTTGALSQIEVKLFVNDINRQCVPNCGNVGSTLLENSYDFSCALNFNELKEVELVINGYDASINDEWTTAVRVTTTHHCTDSDGM